MRGRVDCVGGGVLGGAQREAIADSRALHSGSAVLCGRSLITLRGLTHNLLLLEIIFFLRLLALNMVAYIAGYIVLKYGGGGVRPPSACICASRMPAQYETIFCYRKAPLLFTTLQGNNYNWTIKLETTNFKINRNVNFEFHQLWLLPSVCCGYSFVKLPPDFGRGLFNQRNSQFRWCHTNVLYNTVIYTIHIRIYYCNIYIIVIWICLYG